MTRVIIVLWMRILHSREVCVEVRACPHDLQTLNLAVEVVEDV